MITAMARRRSGWPGTGRTLWTCCRSRCSARSRSGVTASSSRCPAVRRRSCWCVWRSRPVFAVRADRLVDDLWARRCRHSPEHVAVEGGHAAPGARGPAGDRERRRRLRARGRPVGGRRARRLGACGHRGSVARCGRRPRRRRPVRVDIGLFRGELLPAAGDGDWVTPAPRAARRGADAGCSRCGSPRGSGSATSAT